VFPSLMFLGRVSYPLRRRRTLRDRGLLTLRCLALTLLVVGFAAPYCSGPSAGANGALADRVLLLDGSYSMGHTDRWEAALAAARRRIETLAPGQRAALIRVEDRARVVQDLTPDRNRLLTALASQGPGDGGTHFQAALAAAGQLLDDARAPRAVVVLISDLQASGLSRGELSLGAGAELELETIGGSIGPNGAIMAAELLPGQGAERTLRVGLHNSGDAPLQEGLLSLTMEGRPIQQLPFTLAAGRSLELDLPVTLPRQQPTRITLALGPDALTGDNRHHLVLSPGRQLAVGLVEADRRRPDQGVFLEQALALLTQVGEVRRLQAGQLAGQLDHLDVLIFADAPLPGGRGQKALEAFLARGGGLLVMAGEAVGRSWLEDDLPPRPGQPLNRAAAIDPTLAGHPLAVAAGLSAGEAFSAVRVDRYRPLTPGPDDRVVMALTDGSPLLVEHRHPKAQVLVLTTNLDPRWSNLALEPGFVPLMEAMVNHLAGHHQPLAALTLGETLDLARQAGALPGTGHLAAYLAGSGTVVIELPDGTPQRLEPGRALYTPRQVGLFEVHRTDGKGGTLPFAVNGPRQESLLEALEPGDLKRQRVRTTPGDAPGRTRPGNGETRQEWGHRLLLVATLLLILEGLVAHRISLGRRHHGL
ncbi:MAG: VWA domain-containing protein, partial [Candidatus Competibacteraceae bacterium]|nr:VWA domain-containing protein [Candidatus Competibacteraceae bacterium]